MKVAIVHDWLTTYAGAERVLEQLLALYSNADLFSVCDFVPDGERGFLGGRRATTTFIQKLPGARRRYRSYLSLMPLAVEQLDLSTYDVVLSSSHAVAKGVLTGPDQLHISYVHSPIRYAWDLQHQYLKESGLTRGLKGWMARWILHRVRQWDARTANGVDAFVANSQFIARRIWKAYRREAAVIYPPVDVETYALWEEKEDYYLTASRMVPYKRIPMIVEAFAAMPTRRLVVIGDGPEMGKVKRAAADAQNIEIVGYQPHPVLRDYMMKARAFVFAAEEDFGIVPVEAQACGTPVIAYGRGGALETVVELKENCIGTTSGVDLAPTGVFFREQSVEAICAAVERFEANRERFSAEACRNNAVQFSCERFRREFSEFVENAWIGFGRGMVGSNPNRTTQCE